MLLLLLLGFLPVAPDAAPARSGAPTALATQWRRSSSPDFRAFRERWGADFAARWDLRNGTPRFLYAPGVAFSRADALLVDVARLAGVDPKELAPAAATRHGTRTISRYTRTWNDVPVEGDEVSFVVTDGGIGGIWVRLTPLAGLPTPTRPGERVIVVPTTGKPALVRRTDTAEEVYYTDRAGRVVHRYDPRHFASVDQTWEERTVDDPLILGAARKVTVTDAAGVAEVTADDGSHGRAGTVDIWLDGPELAVTENGASLHVTADADATLNANQEIGYAAADVLHHFHAVRDWLAVRWPTHGLLSLRVPADVENTGGTCNAYYTSGTLTFYPAQSGSCNDLGRIADVIYHEVGHGIHDYIIAAGSFASDVSEGSADYVSATINDDPYLAPEAWGSGSYIRELETDKVYPVDVTGEVHADGLIWGSFLWNLRDQWITAYGTEPGVEQTDLLFLGALEQGPTLTDLYEAVLMADDDDGDFANGVPHACELKELLDQHGLGPGPIGVVIFDHVPLGAQASATPDYPVSFELYDLTPDCSGLDDDSVELWYTTDDSPLPTDDGGADTGDTGGDTGGGSTSTPEGWLQVPLSHTGTTWTGAIPRQPATTHVRYFMRASSTDGTQTIETHDGVEANLYDFWIGDRNALWCQDFEAGAADWTHGAGPPGGVNPPPRWSDQWEIGTPAGGGDWDPPSAYAGTAIANTVMDGAYSPNNSTHLASPVVDLAGHGPMLLLTYQRWLTVEDALYDHADVYVEGTVVWSNGATAAGVTQTLDTAWTSQDIALDGRLAADDTVTLAWGLTTDQGLEYGGWALDDVCVVDLADVPGHYRVKDLTASDDAPEVTIQWTEPWMKPLSTSVLVRQTGAEPTGPTDGLILELDQSPTPGEVHLVVDPDAQPGEVFHYAVFVAADDDEDWYTAVVTGENADEGGIPAPAPPEDTGDTAAADTSGPGDDTGNGARDTGGDAEPGGCGCNQGPAAGVPALAALALVLGLRRRRDTRRA